VDWHLLLTYPCVLAQHQHLVCVPLALLLLLLLLPPPPPPPISLCLRLCQSCSNFHL
jgi:hypothetical protein